ncbi:uncharacterized protein GIQ15_05292 [Arthroderma uncinatum]|uniref:uncharacterized protein n=1 Tax=Arthroderma uncinatum TaxID=74035 RepID=UPI00144A7A6E|nr:uncharacterized protein GIQ15_05292 [Arthroderma uncinatum]KAF3482533.1 hypothetical protein GIQ15_05292 [Arthroderma uncinatum]
MEGKVQPQREDDETPQLPPGPARRAVLRVRLHEIATGRPAAPTVFNLAAHNERTGGTGEANGIHGSSPASSSSSTPSTVYSPSEASSAVASTLSAASTSLSAASRTQSHVRTPLKNSFSPAGVRSTRSKPSPLYISHDWEALDIQKSRQGVVVDMSRNRPRGPATRENGLAADEELDSLHRQQLKLSEEERTILQDEPADVTKNLGILIALRSASEADPQSRSISQNKSRKRKGDVDLTSTESPGPSSSGVSDKLNRIKSTTQRSTSVSSSQRENTASLDNGAEGARPSATEKGDQLVPGAEVVFKHNKKQQGIEGEGIQCIIKNITGEGSKRRYDVQDPEPIENGEEGAIYKTAAASLIPIPKAGTPLPQFQLGKQVLARYPDTTTFYRAEVMGLKKDVYRLKFEGEEDDKEMEVDRRYVLDIPNK